MFKELEIMKTTLRYLLMIVAMVSVMSVSAQGLAQKPEVKMTSTSVMAPSGSTLPQAALTGTVTTYSIGSPAKSSKPRKAEDDWEDDDPHDDEEPWTTPIGDAAIPLALLACAYALMRVLLKRKRA